MYIAAQAAKGTMQRQSNVAHNLANVNTPGFRQQLMAFQSAAVLGEGSGTRAFAVETSIGYDFRPGHITQTGRDLDVALPDKGWFAVNDVNGDEAYTRNGTFSLDANGNLVTQEGLAVVGTEGPVAVPPDHRLVIESDGSLSAVPLVGGGNIVALGRLKLVDPEPGILVRGDDGLFRTADAQPIEASNAIRVQSGFIETSNVNAVDMMVQMISAARQYETQMKMLSTAQENSRSANNLFGLS